MKIAHSVISIIALGSLLPIWGQAAVLQAPSDEPKVRLMPQISDTILADIEESADGTRLITHDRKYAPRLWDAKSMRLLRILGGAKSLIPIVRFSSDGKSILTMSRTEVRIWDSLKANLKWELKVPEGDEYYSAIISKDNRYIVAGTDKGMVYLVDTSKSNQVTNLKQNSVAVVSLDISAKGILAAGCSDGSTTLYDLKTSKVVTTLKGNTGQVKWATFSKDGAVLLTTGSRNGVIAWNGQTGEKLYEKPHAVGNRTTSLITYMGSPFVLEGDKGMLYGDDTGLMHICDAKTGVELGQLQGHTKRIREIRVSADGKLVGTYADDETLRFWDVAKFKEIPFKRPEYSPTAGSFTPDSKAFWFGFMNGIIRRYSIPDGKILAERRGAVNPITRVSFAGKDRILLIGPETYSAPMIGDLGETKFSRIFEEGSETAKQELESATYSSNGRFMALKSPPNSAGFSSLVTADWFMNQILFKLDEPIIKTAEFIGDSNLVFLTLDEGACAILDLDAGKFIQSWQWEFANPIRGAVSSNGITGAHFGVMGGEFGTWDVTTGKGETTFDIEGFESIDYAGISDDATLVAGASKAGKIGIWNTKTGKLVISKEITISAAACDLKISKDNSTLIITALDKVTILRLSDLSVLREAETKPTGFIQVRQGRISPAGDKVVTFDENEGTVWNAKDGSKLCSFETIDTIDQATFSPNGQKLITVDRSDGVVIWDLQNVPQSGQASQLGKIVQMRDGSVLVMDLKGRYDATDPSDVTGALYVINWEGGLETVDVAQFKSMFWDPGLLEKLLGMSKEPLRQVPNLDSLRLYPSSKLSLSSKGEVSISLQERDNGGIGSCVVLLNGREIIQKDGVGYFSFKVDEFKQFLLPETQLPPGQGNIVSVKVSNADGTLTSLPNPIDIGIPSGLSVPQVKLYALFCGAGDYAGSAKDLKAPPSDAIKLAGAVTKLADGLLKDRVEVSVLATSEGFQPPTRSNIISWFESVSKKANSGDIILVFMAGHGLDKLGSRVGYYFLTAECDPATVTEASLPSVSISAEDLRLELSKISANKQILILDTCHSGAAAGSLIGDDRSVSGDYQRAWESLKDSTGTWMLAGAAANQLSYESSNVEHGMLTYSLLEAIDKGTGEGLRQTPSGEMFLDVERWLNYAANRVESLKNEVGLTGVQKPEFKRSKTGKSFDIGVLEPADRGFIGLKPPMPIVIVGPFEQEQEDPLNFEDFIRTSMKDSVGVKAWFDVTKHPNVYRMSGEYTVTGPDIAIKVFVQRIDSNGQRKTVSTFEVKGNVQNLDKLANEIRSGISLRVKQLELARLQPTPEQ